MTLLGDDYNKYYTNTLSDVLDINRTGHYLARSTTANNPENSNMLIKAQELPGTGIFLLSGWSNEGGFMYSGVLRDNTVVWKRVDNFGCSTPADLASLLGGRQAGLAGNNFNANGFIEYGSRLFYTSNISSAIGLPSGAVYGYLECTPLGNGRIIQTYRGFDNFAYKKIRKTENDGQSWSVWDDDN